MTADAPQPAAPDTIVLVHGFWVTPCSWEKWVERSADALKASHYSPL